MQSGETNQGNYMEKYKDEIIYVQDQFEQELDLELIKAAIFMNAFDKILEDES